MLALGDLLSAPKVSRARLLDFVSTWPWAQGPVRFGSDLSARVIDVAERNLWERLSRDMGVRNFGMFDFALPIALVGFFGTLYLWLVAPRLLPLLHAHTMECAMS